MGHAPKIVDMQNRPVHHDSPGPDLDPVRAGMEIDSFVQVHAVTETDVVGKPQTDAAFDRGSAIHAQDQAVKQTAQSHADDRGNPPKQEV